MAAKDEELLREVIITVHKSLHVLERYSDVSGCEWNSDTMLKIACDWIDAQGIDGAPVAFKEYVSKLAHAEARYVDEPE
jgi:hypothetical protein